MAKLNRRTALKAGAALTALAAGGYTALPWIRRFSTQPNVIVILIDTLRADHLECYGYPEATAPELTKFAKENALAEFAVSTAPWTPASVASILSGSFVETHGYMPPRRSHQAVREDFSLNPSLSTLPQLLKSQGYVTAGLSTNAWIVEELGFNRGFDRFVYRNGIRATHATDEGIRLLNGLESHNKPFFLYLHYLDPHDPYEPPQRFRRYKPETYAQRYPQQQAEDIALYNGEISFNDEQVGRVLAQLRSRGLYENSLIFIVADHGEQFMEHGFRFHGNQLFNPETHVPLLFRLAGDTPAGTRIAHTVSTIDLHATITDYLGIEQPQSASLGVPLLYQQGQHQSRGGVFSEMVGRLKQRAFTDFSGRRLLVGSNSEQHPLSIEHPTENIIGVFDSLKKPDEREALSEVGVLASLQRGWGQVQDRARTIAPAPRASRGQGAGSDRPVSSETLQSLKSLGYLQ